jgi:transposase
MIRSMYHEIPPIQESLATLKGGLAPEPKARRKTRLQMLYFLKSGQATTREAVAALLAVHRHTISRWLDTYARAGLEELLTLKTHSNRRPALSVPAKQALAKQLKRPAGFRTYLEAQAWLQEQWGLAVKYKTLHRIIRYELGAKLKVARPSHVKKTLPPVRPSKPASPRS